MVTREMIVEVLKERKKNLLLVAESSLSESQFKAFRTIFLAELGEQGFEGELRKLFDTNRFKRDGNGLE